MHSVTRSGRLLHIRLVCYSYISKLHAGIKKTHAVFRLSEMILYMGQTSHANMVGHNFPYNWILIFRWTNTNENLPRRC